MSSVSYGQWIGRSMADEDVSRLLETASWGVLSVAEGDRPYSIPITFGYRDEQVYFPFIRDGPDNRKAEFVAAGDPARLLVTAINARYDWRSAAVEGTVQPVSHGSDAWDALLDSLDGNPWFSPDFGDTEAVEGLQGWRLEPGTVEGLEVRPNDD